jgi:hypothetical protein
MEGEEENEWKFPDLNERLSLPDFRKIMGIKPRVITVDEMLHISKDPANNYREEFYKQEDELPMTYSPPFPLTPGEKRLEELNEKPARWEEYFKENLPFPSLNEEVNRWYDDLRRHGEVKLDRRIIYGDKNSTPIFIHTEPLDSKPPEDIA